MNLRCECEILGTEPWTIMRRQLQTHISVAQLQVWMMRLQLRQVTDGLNKLEGRKEIGELPSRAQVASLNPPSRMSVEPILR